MQASTEVTLLRIYAYYAILSQNVFQSNILVLGDIIRIYWSIYTFYIFWLDKGMIGRISECCFQKSGSRLEGHLYIKAFDGLL